MSNEKKSCSNSNMGKRTIKSCPTDYKNCKCYNSKLKPFSRCIKDSSVGKCLEEHKTWEREVDDYFNEYFEMREIDNSE